MASLHLTKGVSVLTVRDPSTFAARYYQTQLGRSRLHSLIEDGTCIFANDGSAGVRAGTFAVLLNNNNRFKTNQNQLLMYKCCTTDVHPCAAYRSHAAG